MATGDNVLTAISVAGQCGIIEKSQVYLGELSVDYMTNKETLMWQCQNQIEGEFALANSSNIESEDGEKYMSQSSLPWDYLDEKVNVALTGKAFKYIYERQRQNPFMFSSVLAKAKVYARMSPDDKALLVDSLQTNLKINCGMCGDGANDCGALKTELSLSEHI